MGLWCHHMQQYLNSSTISHTLILNKDRFLIVQKAVSHFHWPHALRAIAYFGQSSIHFTSETPEPYIGADDDVLIDVSWCGICGTDLHEYTDGPIFMPCDGETNPLSGKPLPQPLGHEFSGIILDVSKKVTQVKKGDHVVVDASLGCHDTHRWPNSKLSHCDSKPCGACRKGIYNCCEYNGFTGLGVVGGAFAESCCWWAALC